MLVLTRKPGESIIIDGRIAVKIVRVEGDTVKVGIAAPAEVPVHREEIYREIRQSNQAALAASRAPAPRLVPDDAPPSPPAISRPVTVSPAGVVTQKP